MPSIGQDIPIDVQFRVSGLIPAPPFAPVPTLLQAIQPSGATFVPTNAAPVATATGYRYTLAAADTTLYGVGVYRLVFQCLDAAVDDSIVEWTGFIEDELDRLLSVGVDSSGRTVRNALRLLVNRTVLVAGTMTVYKEDDVTPAWTAAIGTDASAAPIVSVDP